MAGPSDILNAIGSAFGVRTEKEPAHEVLATPAAGIEVRRYPARRVYEVRLAAPAVDRAFNMLFRAISGANAGSTAIPMTAPVEQGEAGQRVAMTAPVERTSDGQGWAMRFFLPDDMASPPAPTEAGVELVAVPEQTLGVRRFSGLAGLEKLNVEEATLRDALRVTGWVADGPRMDWFYDPPWCLPPLRRNEVVLPVTRA